MARLVPQMIGVAHHRQVAHLGRMTDGKMTTIGRAHRPRVRVERVVAARERVASLMSHHHHLAAMTGVNGNGMSIHHRHPVVNLARVEVVARVNQGRAILNLLRQKTCIGTEDGVSGIADVCSMICMHVILCTSYAHFSLLWYLCIYQAHLVGGDLILVHPVANQVRVVVEVVNQASLEVIQAHHHQVTGVSKRSCDYIT